jgi:pyroglutamyl-peptidase
MKILITGFTKYQNFESNASEQLILSLKNNLPSELSSLKDDLVFGIISCNGENGQSELEVVENQLKKLVDDYQPRICIFTGQAPGHSKISIEHVALNICNEEKIVADGPVGYWSTLPGIEDLPDILSSHAIPAEHSFHAGTYLCNALLYTALHRACIQNINLKAGFIHISLLPEQIRDEEDSVQCMTSDMVRTAMALIIKHTATVYS